MKSYIPIIALAASAAAESSLSTIQSTVVCSTCIPVLESLTFSGYFNSSATATAAPVSTGTSTKSKSTIYDYETVTDDDTFLVTKSSEELV